MKKKIISIVIALTICLSMTIPALAAGTYSNYKVKNTYSNQFSDVSPADWFAESIKCAYEFGLVNGISATSFAPNDNLTIAQTITLAARLHSIYTTGAEPDATVPEGGNWYDPYVDYARSNNITAASYSNLNAPAMRSEVAVIFAKALPDGALSQIRTVSDGAIPDVQMSASYSSSVYMLYRAGILSGNDDRGTFFPDTNIRRSEIATICVRIADPSKRVTTNIGAAATENLSAEQISEKCAPAVFFIKTYAFNGSPAGTGSGFFISSDGLAVTNYHVAANSIAMEVKLHDGRVLNKENDVLIIDMDEENDLALLRIKGTGFPFLEMGDSASLKQGQQAYAIGSPLGLENTMSQGIVSNPKRVLDKVEFIQISVPITHGSSGGALIDEHGMVIGVTSAGFIDAGADLNLAIPINQVKKLDQKSTDSYLLFNDIYYPTFTQVLDFGEFSGVKLLDADITALGFEIYYDAFDFHDALYWEAAELYARSLAYYCIMLTEAGFKHTKVVDGFLGRYETSTEWVEITSDLTGSRTIRVVVGRNTRFYKEFPSLPDFGWYSDLPLSEGPIHIDDSLLYIYNWADRYYNDIDYFIDVILIGYIILLDELGFELVYFDDEAFLFEGNHLSIVMLMDSEEIFFDIERY